MRRLTEWMIVLGVLLAIANGSVAGGDSADALVDELMSKAAVKDVAGVVALEDRAMKSPGDRYAYHLARYMADPDSYADTFIEEFPASSDGVMGYVYQLELATRSNGTRLTPHFLYSFDELGKLAAGGRPGAVAKLYGVTLHSDGVVTEFVCEKVAQVISGETKIAVDELRKLPLEQRKRVYSCFGAASGGEISSMRASVKAIRSGEQAEIAREVEQALDQAY